MFHNVTLPALVIKTTVAPASTPIGSPSEISRTTAVKMNIFSGMSIIITHRNLLKVIQTYASAEPTKKRAIHSFLATEWIQKDPNAPCHQYELLAYCRVYSLIICRSQIKVSSKWFIGCLQYRNAKTEVQSLYILISIAWIMAKIGKAVLLLVSNHPKSSCCSFLIRFQFWICLSITA